MTFLYIWANLDLKTTYWSLPMAEKAPSLYPSLPDDSSSDEESLYLLKSTIEERCYCTILGLYTATIAALAHLKPQANQVIPRGNRSTKKKKKTTKSLKMFLVPRNTSPSHHISSICTIL